MENYKVIQDEQLLKEFIAWLPDLHKGETFYCCLFARSKYSKEVKGDKQQLKRFTATKEYLFEKISQLEIPLGRYYQNHKSVPQESLALYINPNPRSLRESTGKCLVEMTKQLVLDTGYNPNATALSAIQQSCSRKIFIDFDFDDIAIDPFRRRLIEDNKINIDCCVFLDTKNGFHLLVEVSKIDLWYKNTWYNSIASLEGCDVRGDNLIPVPGTYQGGFTPYFR